VKTANMLGVPLRLFSDVHYCGSFYGQAADGTPLSQSISSIALTKLLRALGPGITELACHPAKTVDFQGMYATERLEELAVLCDKQIRETIAKSRIELGSFHSFKARRSNINSENS
jgi:predicted glycoside hydrolase/deacetylase ChbG (UPF0249 family)